MRVVGGVWRGRKLAAPSGRQTRPTTDRIREAWMSAIAHEIEGSRVVDLFAGSGALGIEALSRGAEHATFVESAAKTLAVLRGNLDSLGALSGSYRLVRSDAFRFVEAATTRSFDIAFADPPYGTGAASRLAATFIDRPFADLLCVEHAAPEAVVGEPIWQRRYGDTVLTFLSAPDDDV